jgi:hypothetical protein
MSLYSSYCYSRMGMTQTTVTEESLQADVKSVSPPAAAHHPHHPSHSHSQSHNPPHHHHNNHNNHHQPHQQSGAVSSPSPRVGGDDEGDEPDGPYPVEEGEKERSLLRNNSTRGGSSNSLPRYMLPTKASEKSLRGSALNVTSPAAAEKKRDD